MDSLIVKKSQIPGLGVSNALEEVLNPDVLAFFKALEGLDGVLVEERIAEFLYKDILAIIETFHGDVGAWTSSEWRPDYAG
jgi:hypothetical protein